MILADPVAKVTESFGVFILLVLVIKYWLLWVLFELRTSGLFFRSDLQVRNSTQTLNVQNRIRFKYFTPLTVFFCCHRHKMPLIIDIMVIAELDSVFTMACLMIFCGNYQTILVRLCVYLLLAIRMKTFMFHSPMSVPLSVSITIAYSEDTRKGDKVPELESYRMKLTRLDQ